MPQPKKAAPKKAAPAKKTVTKKAATKKTTALKKAAPVKKTAVKKSAVKKAAAKKAPVKKSAAKKAPVKRAGAPSVADAPTQVIETPPPPAPPPPPVPAAAPAGAVTVSFEGPVPQRRVTVAFRLILAIPQLLFAAVLGLVAYVLSIIGWFAALFTGELPKGMHQFLGRIVRQWARVYAYSAYLLTDRYPPFALDEPDYVVNADFEPVKLNRLAVLFRLILIIPAGIVFWVVSYGISIAMFVVWLIVLITGRLPGALFEAEAAVIRYEVRFYAFVAMLTSNYPRGLFGDDPSTAPAVADGEPLPERPRITQLVLSKAGKRIVVLFVVLGALIGVGGTIATVVASANSSDTEARLRDHHAELGSAIAVFTKDTAVCTTSDTIGLDCVHAADDRLSGAFAKFTRQVESLDFPASALDEATQVRDDSADLSDSLHNLAGLTTREQYVSAARDFQRLARQFDAHYRDLLDALI